jgi:response regulator RpfG family c-di-GMP phosphodiesterase
MTLEKSDILIVDDSKEVIASIKRELKNEPLNVSETNSGEEALRMVAQQPFKVIITDVKMSKMDGFELLEKIHELNPDTSRIILSGHSDVGLILKLANKKGIDRYLTKPWDAQDLILAINNSIEIHDLRKAKRERADKDKS